MYRKIIIALIIILSSILGQAQDINKDQIQLKIHESKAEDYNYKGNMLLGIGTASIVAGYAMIHYSDCGESPCYGRFALGYLSGLAGIITIGGALNYKGLAINRRRKAEQLSLKLSDATLGSIIGSTPSVGLVYTF